MLSRSAIVTLLLYLIGAPALLIQNAESDVRFVIDHHLRREIYTRAAWPAVVGVVLALSLIIIIQVGMWPAMSSILADGILVVLFSLAIYVSIKVLPISRKRDVVIRLREKMVRQVVEKGTIDDELMQALVVLGTESKPGNERGWAIRALSYITNATVARSDYSGCRLDKVTDALRKIILGSDRMASQENYISAVDVLRPIIQKYYAKHKEDPTFPDGDLYNAFLLLSQMGQRAVEFPVDGVTSACIDGLDGRDIPNSTASQGLCEIGIAAIAKDRVGPAREALHILDALVSSGEDGLCEDEEIIFDYLALLAAFWEHTIAGRAEARRHLDDLYLLDEPHEDDPTPPEDQPQERLLARLVRQAVRHHTTVGRFTIADNIADMWQTYTLDYRP